MSNRRRFAATAVALTLVVGAGAIGYATFLMAPKVRAAGNVGATFTLTDDRGEPITEKALSGHPSLVYFGYTHCPDVCPTTLYDMAGWLKTLGTQADGLKVYFFTVDPERDTPEIMHSYTGNFTDRIIGITGDPGEMQKAIKGWRIYARKVPSPDGGYTMDHTASVLLVDADGNLKGTIAYQENTDVALQKIRNLLQQD
ncbi:MULTISPECIES: SCO family protein [Rhizobium]|uniref:Protein SCO1/2 n=1 Tax=Rhizobium tropici TaxID=398 RepID=A0A6P1CCM5_RHITR|nr:MULTISPECIES: SCO family protein [Rhizobium]AGB74256.1 electron transport protein SCO1/SenC [Rhizobium tropici CIAT 899]MBB4240742.1 protein SCO1/2 [Rhizobium tropici]MBB5591841.1 protein SCO1/2 [Rhizobium tropici]MBB6490895.1 protein SCO1/2 [Rhizobium tropici]NEV14597.1 SCO family protein [Rhizobium tropici]